MIFPFVAQQETVTLLWNALLIILVIASLASHLKIPYEVGLVAAGILASVIAPHALPQVSPRTFLDFLLPPIIFHTAIHLDLKTLTKEGKFVFMYAFVGTLLTFALISVFSFYFLGIGLADALLLGIIISPTDPISVISTLRQLNAPSRLTRIIEGEALFNDGVAIVIFTALAQSVLGSISFPGISLGVLVSILSGVGSGFVVGYASSLVATRLRKDIFVQTTLSFFAMYASYQLSSFSGGSGIVGVAFSGIILGDQLKGKVSKDIFSGIDNVWEFLDFLVTSFSYILIGVLLSLQDLYMVLPVVLLTFVIVMISRAAMVFGITSVLNLWSSKVTQRWQTVITSAGLKGVVSIMLASILPAGSKIVEIVVGVVFFSVIVQGLTLGPIMRRLLKKDEEDK